MSCSGRQFIRVDNYFSFSYFPIRELRLALWAYDPLCAQAGVCPGVQSGVVCEKLKTSIMHHMGFLQVSSENTARRATCPPAPSRAPPALVTTTRAVSSNSKHHLFLQLTTPKRGAFDLTCPESLRRCRGGRPVGSRLPVPRLHGRPCQVST